MFAFIDRPDACNAAHSAHGLGAATMSGGMARPLGGGTSIEHELAGATSSVPGGAGVAATASPNSNVPMIAFAVLADFDPARFLL